MTYLVVRKGNAFGDNLLSGWFCRILNDNGIEAHYHHESNFPTEQYVPDLVLKRPGVDYCPYEFTYVGAWDMNRLKPDLGFMEWLLDDFRRLHRIERPIVRRNHYLPVVYRDNPAIKGVDVAMNTSSSQWVKHRDYPWFDAIKHSFDRTGIRWVDLDQQRIRGNDALNHVKKSTVYLGLETGMSHYVSSVANHPLVIQSGFTNHRFWNHYGYDVVEHRVHCAPCQLRYSPCPHNHSCMNGLDPSIIVERVIRKLNGAG